MDKFDRATRWVALVMLLGASAVAVADHDRDRYGAATVSSSAYRSHVGPTYAYADVISARPVIRYVNVSNPVRECWQDVEHYTVARKSYGSAGRTLVGAVVGGVVGHQFGSGRGNDAATVAGTLLGAAIANDVARHRHAGPAYEQHSRPVRRCETRYEQHQEERIDGYDVVYRYKGQKYATRMPYDPGRKIRIRIDIRPVA